MSGSVGLKVFSVLFYLHATDKPKCHEDFVYTSDPPGTSGYVGKVRLVEEKDEVEGSVCLALEYPLPVVVQENFYSTGAFASILDGKPIICGGHDGTDYIDSCHIVKTDRN